MQAISKLRFFFLSVMLCIFPACNENYNVVYEYDTGNNFNPAPNLTENKDRNNPIDKGMALLTAAGADMGGGFGGAKIGAAACVPLGPVGIGVGGVIGSIIGGGGASYGAGVGLDYIFVGGGSNGGGTGGANPGGNNPGGNNGNSGNGGGYTGPGAPGGGGGQGNGGGRKPIVGANTPFDNDYVVSNADYIGYLHNALLVHLDANMPAFDTVDVTVLTNMYNLSKDFILGCGYFTVSDVNNCLISLDDYIAVVRPFFDVRDLNDVINIIEQVNTSDANQNIVKNSIIDALNAARDMPPDYLYASNYFQTMETNIIGSLNLFQPIWRGGANNNSSTTTAMSYSHLALPIAKYSYAIWYKYMYLQDE